VALNPRSQKHFNPLKLADAVLTPNVEVPNAPVVKIKTSNKRVKQQSFKGPSPTQIRFAYNARQMAEVDCLDACKPKCKHAMKMAYWLVTRKYTKDGKPPMVKCQQSAAIFAMSNPKRFDSLFTSVPKVEPKWVDEELHLTNDP